MGSGHVMRALALAQAWQARGGRVVFATHCDSAALRAHIDALGITRLDIRASYPHTDDREQTLAFIEQVRPAWAVLDGYHFAPDYQQAVHQSGTRLLVLDDMAHQSRYHADIVLNQNIYAHALTYRCAPRTRLLRGTRYALLRPEFADWRAWRRDVPQSGQNVLVTLGGTDPDNAARKVIQALSSWRGQNFAVKVVVGPGNPHLESLRETVAQCGRDMKLVIAPDNMPALMAWADVAVAAAGTTTLELAYMQTPAVALVLADNQVQIADALDAAGTIHNLGWHTALTNRALACTVRDLGRQPPPPRQHGTAWQAACRRRGRRPRRVPDAAAQPRPEATRPEADKKQRRTFPFYARPRDAQHTGAAMRVLFLGNGPVACDVLKYLRDGLKTDIGAKDVQDVQDIAGAGAQARMPLNVPQENNSDDPDDLDTIVGLVLHPDGRARQGEELRGLSGLPTAQIFDGSKLREASTLAAIRDLQADIAVSVFFGYILRPPFLDLFSKGVVNLHPSLLPYNRGANPNVWSIVDGTPSGVTLHYIDAGVDTGDIIAQWPVCVSPTDTGKTLYARLEQACGALFRDTWPRLSAGTAPRIAQKHGLGITHRRSDVCALDCLDLDAPTTARQVLDLLRARTFSPYAGAYFEDEGQKIYLRLQLLTESQLQSE